ncbi:ABC transporter permease [Chloroflexota bacterium]
MVVRLLLSRGFLFVVTLLAVSMLIFVMAEVLPGDIAVRVLGRESTEQARQAFRERLNLDRPIHERYWLWLQGAVRGDFGASLTNERAVSDIVGPRLRNTLIIGGAAFLLYIPVTLILASLAAVFRDRTIDGSISVLTLVGLSMPEFVTGTILLIVFAVAIPIFPVMSLVDRAETPGEYLRTLALPAITLMVIMSVYAIRMLRDNLIEVLDSEYVRMATLKGLSRRRVIFRHALPNAIVPALNITALNLAYLLGGVVLVERVFSYPGLGSLLVDSILLRDVPVIEAIVLLIAAVYILGNLVADVMTIVLNPRLRSG